MEGAPPQDVIAWSMEEFGDRMTIATGFGAEGVAMIDMAVRINPTPPSRSVNWSPTWNQWLRAVKQTPPATSEPPATAPPTLEMPPR